MDISGGKAYLNPAEQKQSGLDSPIELNGFPIAERLKEAADKIQRLELVLNSDPEDFLPTEKGAVRPELARAQAQHVIYSGIAGQMALEGSVDLSAVIDQI
jgi:hypothetical protein